MNELSLDEIGADLHKTITTALSEIKSQQDRYRIAVHIIIGTAIEMVGLEDGMLFIDEVQNDYIQFLKSLEVGEYWN